MTAKSKRIGKCQRKVCFYSSIRDTIQITFFILFFQVDRGRNDPLIQGETSRSHRSSEYLFRAH